MTEGLGLPGLQAGSARSLLGCGVIEQPWEMAFISSGG